MPELLSPLFTGFGLIATLAAVICQLRAHRGALYAALAGPPARRMAPAPTGEVIPFRAPRRAAAVSPPAGLRLAA